MTNPDVESIRALRDISSRQLKDAIQLLDPERPRLSDLSQRLNRDLDEIGYMDDTEQRLTRLCVSVAGIIANLAFLDAILLGANAHNN